MACKRDYEVSCPYKYDNGQCPPDYCEHLVRVPDDRIKDAGMRIYRAFEILNSTEDSMNKAIKFAMDLYKGNTNERH